MKRLKLTKKFSPVAMTQPLDTGWLSLHRHVTRGSGFRVSSLSNCSQSLDLSCQILVEIQAPFYRLNYEDDSNIFHSNMYQRLVKECEHKSSMELFFLSFHFYSRCSTCRKVRPLNSSSGNIFMWSSPGTL